MTNLPSRVSSRCWDLEIDLLEKIEKEKDGTRERERLLWVDSRISSFLYYVHWKKKDFRFSLWDHLMYFHLFLKQIAPVFKEVRLVMHSTKLRPRAMWLWINFDQGVASALCNLRERLLLQSPHSQIRRGLILQGKQGLERRLTRLLSPGTCPGQHGRSSSVLQFKMNRIPCGFGCSQVKSRFLRDM